MTREETSEQVSGTVISITVYYYEHKSLLVSDVISLCFEAERSNE